MSRGGAVQSGGGRPSGGPGPGQGGGGYAPVYGGGGQSGATPTPGGHGVVPHAKGGGVGACPMGVECVSNKTHGGLAGAGMGQGQPSRHRVGAGAAMATQRVVSSVVQAPMTHGNDHWLPLAMSEVPVGVRVMLGNGVGWRTHRAERRWWGFDGHNYYAWLVDGPAPLAGAPGLGAQDNTPGAGSTCCQTNSGLYWIAGAIFTLAVAVGANVMKGPKKKTKKI